MARTRASTGAVRQSVRTAAVSSFPNAFDATAPWEPVQNTHRFRSETNAANSSRSPIVHSDGPRMTSSISRLK